MLNSRIAAISLMGLALACNRAPTSPATDESEAGEAASGAESSPTGGDEVEAEAEDEGVNDEGPKLDHPGDWGGEEDADSGANDAYEDEEVECWSPVLAVATEFEGAQVPESCGELASFEGRLIAAEDRQLVFDACPCDMDCAEVDPQRFFIDHQMFESVMAYEGECLKVTASASECEQTTLLVETFGSLATLRWFYGYSEGVSLAAGSPVFENESLTTRVGELDEGCVIDGIPIERRFIEGELNLGIDPQTFSLPEGVFEQVDSIFIGGKFGSIQEFWGHVHQARSFNGSALGVQLMIAQRQGPSL